MKCPKCDSEIVNPEITRFCAVCNYPFIGGGVLHEKSNVDEKTVCWEQIEKKGFVTSLLSTIRESLLSPSLFFDCLKSSTNTFMALLYALVVSSIGSVFSFLWSYFFITPLLAFVPGLEDYTGRNELSLTGLVFSPFIMIVKLAFAAVYFQILLLITGSRPQNIKATFRILCYAESASIIECIPILGSIMSPFWSLYLIAVGFSKVHGISMIRSIAIILLPVLIIGALLLAGIFMLVGTGMFFQDVFKDLLQMIRY
jgi:hypothetical protein